MAQRSCLGTSEMAPTSAGYTPLDPKTQRPLTLMFCVSGELSWGGRRLLWRGLAQASPRSLAASM